MRIWIRITALVMISTLISAGPGEALKLRTSVAMAAAGATIGKVLAALAKGVTVGSPGTELEFAL